MLWIKCSFIVGQWGICIKDAGIIQFSDDRSIYLKNQVFFLLFLFLDIRLHFFLFYLLFLYQFIYFLHFLARLLYFSHNFLLIFFITICLFNDLIFLYFSLQPIHYFYELILRLCFIIQLFCFTNLFQLRFYLIIWLIIFCRLLANAFEPSETSFTDQEIEYSMIAMLCIERTINLPKERQGCFTLITCLFFLIKLFEEDGVASKKRYFK